MKKVTLNKRIACYIVCAVMALTGACTTSYAIEGDNAAGEGAADNEAVTNEEQIVVEEPSDVVEPEEEAVLTDESEPSEEAALEEESEDGLAVMSTETAVTGITAKYADGTVTVSWNKVEGAESYEIQVGDNKATASNSEVSKGIKMSVEAKMYKVSVTAVMPEGTDPVTGSIDVYLKAKTAPKNAKITTEQMHKAYDKPKSKISIKKQRKTDYRYKIVIVEPDVTISWDKVPGATSYKVYKFTGTKKGKINNSTKKVLKSDITGTSYKYKEKVTDKVFSKLNYGYYWYKVAAVYPDGTEKVAAAKRVDDGKVTSSKRLKMPKFLDVSGVSKTGQKTGRKGICTYTFYCKTNQSAKFYKQGSGQAYKRWIPAGVKGTTRGGSGSKFEVKTKGYGTGYVMRHKMTCYKIDYSPNVDWTKSMKEKWVNKSSDFKGAGKWVVWVSRYSQTVNVFKKVNGKYKLMRVCECTTGQFRNYTAGGKFKLHKRIEHRKRSAYHYYYLNCFNGINSVHGPTYKYSGIINSKPSTHLGKNGMSSGTLGCVRSWNEDAYYVWTHVPMNSRVVSY